MDVSLTIPSQTSPVEVSIDPEILVINEYLETFNSRRELVDSESSSSDYDNEGDQGGFAPYANDNFLSAKGCSSKCNTITNLNPMKRLLSGEKTVDDISLLEPEEYAGIEDRVIAKNLRIVVFAIFFTLCIALPIVVYKTMSKHQEESFYGTFHSHSTKVLDSFDVKLARQWTAVDSLRISLTSYASSSLDREETSKSYLWPYVILPDWDLRANNVRDMGDLLSIILSPVVTQQQRLEWQNYTQDNLGWLLQAQERCSHHNTCHISSEEVESLQNIVQSAVATSTDDLKDAMWVDNNGQHVSKEIYRTHPSGLGFLAELTENSPFLPMWTQMPPVSTLINFNIRSLTRAGSAAAEAVGTGKVTLSQIEDFEIVGPSQGALLTEYFTIILRDHIGDANLRYIGDPVATMSFPVFDSFDIDSEGVVAVLTSIIYFQNYFSNVLPGDSGAVIVVVSTIMILPLSISRRIAAFPYLQIQLCILVTATSLTKTFARSHWLYIQRSRFGSITSLTPRLSTLFRLLWLSSLYHSSLWLMI
jgi:hypothetical protein